VAGDGAPCSGANNFLRHRALGLAPRSTSITKEGTYRECGNFATATPAQIFVAGAGRPNNRRSYLVICGSVLPNARTYDSNQPRWRVLVLQDQLRLLLHYSTHRFYSRYFSGSIPDLLVARRWSLDPLVFAESQTSRLLLARLPAFYEPFSSKLPTLRVGR
jgi:hypothetical protein